MPVIKDLTEIGKQKVKKIGSNEVLELQSLWQDQNVAVVFFRRWGCTFCRLWAKELGLIYPLLRDNGIKLVGIGVEEAGSKEFVDGKYFDGDLYYVEKMSTYQQLGFKRMNLVTIISTLLWKQSRDAISKGKSMGLGGDTKGDWVQIGGALLVKKGGDNFHQFVQSGPADHLANHELLKYFGLEKEYKAETMDNNRVDQMKCTDTQK